MFCDGGKSDFSCQLIAKLDDLISIVNNLKRITTTTMPASIEFEKRRLTGRLLNGSEI